MHHNVSIHHLQMLLHASVVDLFSPIQHINEKNDLSKATSYSYVESEIALWRNTALSKRFFFAALNLYWRVTLVWAALISSWPVFLGKLVQLSAVVCSSEIQELMFLWVWLLELDNEVWKPGLWLLMLCVDKQWFPPWALWDSQSSGREWVLVQFPCSFQFAPLFWIPLSMLETSGPYLLRVSHRSVDQKLKINRNIKIILIIW